MAFKGCGKLDTLADTYDRLDDNVKGFIEDTIASNGQASCLLRLLKVGQKMNGIPTRLCQILMEKYQINVQELDFYSFYINDQCMNITLEDVLFLTWLPIDGKPVFPACTRDEGAFLRLFGMNETTLSLCTLKEIALGQSPTKTKIYALLLMVITCMIVPSGDGHLCRPSYVQFIENLDDVNSYAWGAALLSFLYYGMKHYVKRGKKTCDGNMWVLLGFFVYHIPKLREELDINLKQAQPPAPLLFSVVEALHKIGLDHYATYEQKTVSILDNLQDTDMDWHPYTAEMLPAQLHDQIPYRTRLSPLFCYNFVEHQLPNRVARQFKAFEGLNFDGVGDDLKLIKFKANRGKIGPNLSKHYNNELAIWNKRQLVERCCSPRHSDLRSPIQDETANTSCNSFHNDSPIRESMHYTHISSSRNGSPIHNDGMSEEAAEKSITKPKKKRRRDSCRLRFICY